MPETCQSWGALAIALPPLCDVPSISHIATVPLLLRHRTSALESPLKSPTPATFQSLDIWPTVPPPVMVWSFICHVLTVPSSPRHRTSSRRSPLKSPTPAMCWLVGELDTIP